MERLINYLLDKKLLLTLVAFMMLLAGYVSISGMNRESIPDINFDMVTIATVYPGASPKEAEELISIPIEKKLRSINDLDKVRAYNVENLSLLVVYIEDKAKDKKKTVQDIKDAVEQVGNLPSNSRPPVVAEVSFDTTEIMSVAFTGKNGEIPYAKIREFANEAEDYFYDIDGIGEVEKFGYDDREFLVEVDPDAMDRNRIGINNVVNALRMRNVDYPGGPLRIRGKEFVLRTKGQFKNAQEIRNTVIRGNDTGYILKIKDIAKVTDTYKEAEAYHRFNGQRAVVFKLWKKRSADEIELAGRLKKAIADCKIPGYKDVKISFFSDKSAETKRRIASVVHEAVVGFLILGLFILMLLGRHMTTIVLAGIPVTFMITFVVMKYMGITVNIMSLFGMIMVLGMMVDFSVVIAENCHRYMEEGFKRREAVAKGVSEVFGSVTATLICIIAAFMPLLLVSGTMGKFVKPIPIVIISALISAWFIAMFMIPTYLNMFLPEGHSGDNRNFLQKFLGIFFKSKRLKDAIKDIKDEDSYFEGGIFGHVQRVYKSMVSVTLKFRYITVGALIALFIFSLSLVPKLGFKFIPGGGEEQIRFRVNIPFESTLESNLVKMKEMEKLLLKSVPQNEFKSLHVYVGEDYTSITDPKPANATYKSIFELYLVPETERTRTADEINLDLRKKVSGAQKKGLLAQDMEVKVESVFNGPPVGKPVNVEIQGQDFKVIEKIAAEYAIYLKKMKGLRDVTIDLERGKTEYHYTANERMAAITGLSTYDIASSINASFSGTVSTSTNLNEEEVGVRVRFEENARRKMKGLHEVKISNNRGGLIPLDMVSKYKIDRGYSQINRLNFKRLVQVQAEVDTSVITPVEVTKILAEKFSNIENKYPGYIVRYGGEQEDTNESMGELAGYFLGALLFIFIVITVFMDSMVMPIVIMIAIPFALIGVIFALFLHGMPMSFMSTLGLFSLAGIIVSNTLVLVQFINKFRDEGMTLKEALVEGGVVRLRPIILTAGSMILELIPVMYGVGGKDYLVSPLALAFGYGLMFATFITLILIPCFYHVAEDMKGAVAKIFSIFGINISKTIYKPKIQVN